jgi:aspartyl-tRNA(Asn)/glutamyl-tRNA(Gln) amidotransferase subunit B
MNTSGINIDKLNIKPEELAELIVKVDKQELLNSKAKELLDKSLRENISLGDLLKSGDNKVISDSDSIKTFAEQVLSENTKAVEDFKAGKETQLVF